MSIFWNSLMKLLIKTDRNLGNILLRNDPHGNVALENS
jgi:hypothetical protein